MNDIQTFSVLIQAIASIILVVVTTVYVVLSYKILHAPRRAFLLPVSIHADDNGWILKVCQVSRYFTPPRYHINSPPWGLEGLKVLV